MVEGALRDNRGAPFAMFGTGAPRVMNKGSAEMKLTFAFAASATAIALAACTTTAPTAEVAVPAEVAAPVATESAHDQLFRLFKESDEANLKRNPLNALFRGDMRYADHFGDYISDEYYAGEKAAAEHDLAALHAIDRASLNETDPLA